MRPSRPLTLALAALTCAAGPALAWGDRGHELVNAAAAAAQPADVPACLRQGQARLRYLGPEPDRWRHSDLTAMDKCFSPDHFLDLELLEGVVDPDQAPPHRYAFVETLIKAGKDPTHVGLAPYRVVELCQRIEAAVVALELIDPEHAQAAERRAQAEANLVHVAGVLGHYIADLGNPHHTTIHYNGWKGENPEGFATDRNVHFRFESSFVNRVAERLHPRVTAAPRSDVDYAREVWGLIRESNGLVRELYTLDRDGAFAEGDEESEVAARGVRFAEQRMTRAATLLRDLWATACARGKVRARTIAFRDALRERLSAEGIELWVDVDPERNVTLFGRLESPAAHARALELCRAADGVGQVTSRVQVLY